MQDSRHHGLVVKVACTVACLPARLHAGLNRFLSMCSLPCLTAERVALRLMFMQQSCNWQKRGFCMAANRAYLIPYHLLFACQVLVETVCPVDGSTKWIVPRLLFLDNYFTCVDKSNWSWQSGSKMHTIGSLILQTVFRFKSVRNILNMDALFFFLLRFIQTKRFLDWNSKAYCFIVLAHIYLLENRYVVNPFKK